MKNKREKRLKTVIVTENLLPGSGDWRGYAICVDSNGVEWELRGYASDTAEWAERSARAMFNEDEIEWELHGCPLSKEKD